MRTPITLGPLRVSPGGDTVILHWNWLVLAAIAYECTQYSCCHCCHFCRNDSATFGCPRCDAPGCNLVLVPPSAPSAEQVGLGRIVASHDRPFTSYVKCGTSYVISMKYEVWISCCHISSSIPDSLRETLKSGIEASVLPNIFPPQQHCFQYL